MWIHDERRLLRGPDGEPQELVGSRIDVTARKNAEEALKACDEAGLPVRCLSLQSPIGSDGRSSWLIHLRDLVQKSPRWAASAIRVSPRVLGDSPGAVGMARGIRAAILDRGITLEAFA